MRPTPTPTPESATPLVHPWGFGTPIPRARRLWALAAIGANALFLITALAAAAWQGNRYQQLRHSISDTYAARAPHAGVMLVVTTLAGAITLGFCVYTLWPALRSAGWRAAAGVGCLAASIFGVGDLLTPFERLGCRLADPGCTPASQLASGGGRLDATLSTAGDVLLVASAFLLASAMTRLVGLHTWTRATRWCGGALTVTLIANAAAPEELRGLAERLFAAAGVTFIAVVAIAVSRTPRRHMR